VKLHWLTATAGFVLGLGLIVGLASCTGEGEGEPTPSDSGAVIDDPSAAPSDTPTETPTDEPSVDPSADPSASPEPTIDPSSTLDAITVTGEPGEKPTVTVPAPWAIDKSRNRVLTYGSGNTVPSAGLIKVHYIGINGRTGESFDNSYDSGAPLVFNINQVVAGFTKGLVGQRVGSRVLLAMPGSEGYDGSDMTASGIEEGDTLIFVADIIEAPLTGPAGSAVAPVAGLPVVAGEIGRPTLSLPQGATFPTTLVTQPLTKGSGEVIAADSQIQVNYAEYAWSPDGTFRLIRQTYGNSPVTGYLSETIDGWQQGLLEVPQGSRVLLVVPSAQGYPAGNEKTGVKAGDASVFVIDVLFA
jgi:peptidylprolyl isomerase